ncbi:MULTISPECIES: WxL domain-containing protein [Bacteria]|uniref:WxL domain-containing protein n=1 Tax=Bacteria TaxID=2 RepID=UPI001157F07E|nr:WxL domain-containing protein [Enterococcus faecium]MDQ8233198.1 WxL domain-containing protein [Enterococcus faecium]MDQ8240540.1 WxL domain-containing protein [Enterococcus faecium]MDQ8294352.1 WxL domain-containing protein [Enterococcus faecium]
MKKHVTLFSSVLMMSTTLLGAGGVFAEVNSATPSPATAETPVAANLTVDTTTKPVLPGETNDGNHNNTETTDPLGIAYTPKTLSGSGKLNPNGTQTIDLANNSSDKYHVGVKDLTREKHEWTLTAQLSWNEDTKEYMNGTKISLAGGQVQENKSGVLQALQQDEVTGQSTVDITTIAPAEVMKSVKEKTQNGFYDYKFDSAGLVIPETSSVPAGNYNGNINWSLQLTPQ